MDIQQKVKNKQYLGRCYGLKLLYIGKPLYLLNYVHGKMLPLYKEMLRPLKFIIFCLIYRNEDLASLSII